MSRALTLAITALALVPAQAVALTGKTSKGRSCEVSTPANMTGTTANYGVVVEESSCNPGIRVVKSLVFLSQHSGAVEDSSQRDESPLDHENQESTETMGSGYAARHDFSVVLSHGRSKDPERWRRGNAPDDCRVATTFFRRDTLTCVVRSPLN